MRTERLKHPPQTPRQQGFTLIEAMVSLVVLSVGMLGIAALYAQARPAIAA